MLVLDLDETSVRFVMVRDRAERGGVAHGEPPRWSRAWTWGRPCEGEEGQLGSVSPAMGRCGCVTQARVI